MSHLFGYIAKGFQGEGGWNMWILLTLMMISWGFIVERGYYLLLKCGMGRTKFMGDLYKIIKTGDYQRAVKYTSSFTTPLAKVMAAVLLNKDRGEKAMSKAVDEVFLTEVPKVQRYTSNLLTIANVATLIGLLGTVFGLIFSFDAVANVPVAQRGQALAVGIAVGMTNTLFGLAVAIPCLLIQGFYQTLTDRIVEEMDEKSTKLINLLSAES